ncbi:hypothetical protein WICPIJ_002276 [Wickerhamomyces pijperi]|uniref:Uncharacterized protein n=1 Tax=Wickerhamomyces pijperi TaxID=599730 RepID=A0A9P8QC76_WICPI|nr:hypothetical protein WICPIJ_002276 [Wickerhamomyces pijperi]
MIQQSTRSGNQQVDTFNQLLRFGTSVGPTDDNTDSLRMELHDFSSNTKDLQGQFSGWRDDNDTGPVSWFELQVVQQFDSWDQES